MQQLKMWWNRKPPDPVALPGNFSVRAFQNTESDINAWIAICKTGMLLPEDATKQNFIDTMVDLPSLRVEDIRFIITDSLPVATVTPVIQEPGKHGYIHMVACLPAYRGLGLGSQLNRIALQAIYQAGCQTAHLTTDDFRIPAVKSYISARFLPVLYAQDMEERWLTLLRELKIPTLDAVDQDGKFMKVLTA